MRARIGTAADLRQTGRPAAGSANNLPSIREGPLALLSGGPDEQLPASRAEPSAAWKRRAGGRGVSRGSCGAGVRRLSLCVYRAGRSPCHYVLPLGWCVLSALILVQVLTNHTNKAFKITSSLRAPTFLFRGSTAPFFTTPAPSPATFPPSLG